MRFTLLALIAASVACQPREFNNPESSENIQLSEPKFVENPSPQDPPPQPERMSSFSINGFSLSGAEYWPNVGRDQFNYPNDVRWGFYPNDPAITEKTLECAHKGWTALKTYLETNPAELQEVVALGATPRFYLWTNSHDKDELRRSYRPNRMWHWNGGNQKNYSQGFWKWESTLTREGECLVPQIGQIRKTLKQTKNILETQQR